MCATISEAQPIAFAPADSEIPLDIEMTELQLHS
jgi:hypothetical protein